MEAKGKSKSLEIRELICGGHAAQAFGLLHEALRFHPVGAQRAKRQHFLGALQLLTTEAAHSG